MDTTPSSPPATPTDSAPFGAQSVGEHLGQIPGLVTPRRIFIGAGLALAWGVACASPVLIWAIVLTFTHNSAASSGGNDLANLVFALFGLVALGVGAVAIVRYLQHIWAAPVFIAAGLLAYCAMNLVYYTSLQPVVAGLLGWVLALAAFAGLMLSLTWLIRRGSVGAVVLGGALLLGGLSGAYFALGSQSFRAAYAARTNPKALKGVTYVVYTPSSGWKVSNVRAGTAQLQPGQLTLYATKGSTTLILSEGGTRALAEGGNSQVTYTSNPYRTPKGNPVYVYSTPNTTISNSYSAAVTQVGGTYIAITDTNGNIHDLQTYAALIDTLQPTAQSGLVQYLAKGVAN